MNTRAITALLLLAATQLRAQPIFIEAESFKSQTLTDKRKWHIFSAQSSPQISPDGDPVHLAGASGGAYIEVLPDTRRSHDDKLIKSENFIDEGGKMAVLSYKVTFPAAGRYYVWVRGYSTTSEDNGLHFGLNGKWPESGARWQTVQKNGWNWDCKQRTAKVHTGVPMQLWLDVEKAGEHELLMSMREDGIEVDQLALTTDVNWRPDGYKERAAAAAPASGAAKRFPAHWGEPPAAQTRDIRPLPGGYGEGSGTLANWIQQNLDKDAAAKSGNLTMNAPVFMTGAKGYYLDKGKWLAINPEKNKEGSAQAAFPFPSGKYDVTLRIVGESDGQSTYQVAVNDAKVVEFKAPTSTAMFEEGPKFATTLKGVALNNGDVIRLTSQIASADGKEFSRARVAGLDFAPADDATKAAAAKVAASTPASPAKPTGPALVQPRKPDGDGTVAISGELKQWHKVTLTLDGPFTHERDTQPNPFTDVAFNVTFTHESGAPKYTVPGYFAADGDAGNSSAESGTKWRAHLSPDKPGRWTWETQMWRSKNLAVGLAGEDEAHPVASGNGKRGEFTIAASDKTGRDFRAQGRLQYVGKHHLQFAGSKEFFLKAGPDAPETLLAYSDFDNTIAGKADKVPLKTWQPHVGDWKVGDPTWRDGKGKGLIGALNYLARKGVNAFSFLTYNASGDGDNVWPFVERDAKLHYDCSKLDQWGVVFDHATARGLYLHFKLQENELDDNRLGGPKRTHKELPEALDGGKLGIERRLYCRELIARFGHALALNWNIGEENTQSTEEIRDMVKFLHDTDPYRHHIVLHTFPPEQEKVYTPLLGDQSMLTGVSLQNSWKAAHEKTLQWVRKSAKEGRPWVVANDEQNPASLGVPPDPGYKGHDGIAVENDNKGSKAEGFTSSKPYTMHDVRKLCLWGTLMAGGSGVEYYFGYKLPENDLVCEDFRSRDKSWDYCRIALDFFRDEKIPFADMQSLNALIGNTKDNNDKFCFAKLGEIYLVYLPNGGSTDLDLSTAEGTFTVSWFNPRSGGKPADGSVKAVEGGKSVTLGNPPSDPGEDWLILIRR